MTELVPRSWLGETAVCLGTGPSLTTDDVESCRGRGRVICVNDAYRMAPWADALYAADAAWWKVHEDARSFKGACYTAEGLTNETRNVVIPGVTILKHGGWKGLSTKPDRICYGVSGGNHSGYQALNLAVLYGAKRILLLGYDMQWADKRNHFFGQHPSPLQNSSHYDLFMRCYLSALEPLRALGVTVINCTRDTELTCFPQMSLDEALMERAA